MEASTPDGGGCGRPVLIPTRPPQAATHAYSGLRDLCTVAKKCCDFGYLKILFLLFLNDLKSFEYFI